MTTDEYAMQIAEAVRAEAMSRYADSSRTIGALAAWADMDLDAIIASVPKPTVQHHAAPTCDGWWWVSVHGGEWQMKCVVGKTVWQNAQGESWRMSYSGWNARWVGPLLPPDTTEPVPTCVWTENEEGAWRTACGRTWEFSVAGTTPKENGVRFCFGCGVEVTADTTEPVPVKYGCHCDLENTVSGEPDDCVFDNGDIEDCVYAMRLQGEKKCKTDCEYWKPILPKEVR